MKWVGRFAKIRVKTLPKTTVSYNSFLFSFTEFSKLLDLIINEILRSFSALSAKLSASFSKDLMLDSKHSFVCFKDTNSSFKYLHILSNWSSFFVFLSSYKWIWRTLYAELTAFRIDSIIVTSNSPTTE